MRMNANKTVINPANRISVDTDTLASYLGCGKVTAIKIGDAANARIRVGKRVLFNLRKIQAYLDALDNETEVESGIEGVINDT